MTDSKVSKSHSRSLLKQISSTSVLIKNHFKNLTWGINPIQFTLCSFVDGAADVICFEIFGLYCTMMTGNLISFAISLSQRNFSKALLSVVVILTYISGCYISDILMFTFKDDRRKSYLICAPFQIIGLLCVGLISRNVPYYSFTVLPLVFSFGLLNTWGNRLGYTAQMMTGNMQSLSFFMFNLCYVHKTFNEKEKADAIIYVMLLIGYFLGACLSALVLEINGGDAQNACLYLIVVVFLKLLASQIYSTCECDKLLFFRKYFPFTQIILDNFLHPHFHHPISLRNTHQNRDLSAIDDDHHDIQDQNYVIDNDHKSTEV